jgi:hypothetical protein
MTRVVQVYLFAGLLAVVPVAALAQDTNTAAQSSSSIVGNRFGPGIGVGAVGGAIFSDLSQPNVSWPGGHGAVGGVSIEARRSGLLSLTTQALYAEKSSTNLGAHGRIRSIEVPVLARIGAAVGERSRVRVYGVAGPAFDFNFSVTPSLPGVKNYNAVDVNAVAGLGIEIAQLTLEARENIGLRQLQPNTPNLTARSFVLMFGVRLR